jgi:hypothetical protein
MGRGGCQSNTYRCHGTTLSLVRVMSCDARRDLVKKTKTENKLNNKIKQEKIKTKTKSEISSRTKIQLKL